MERREIEEENQRKLVKRGGNRSLEEEKKAKIEEIEENRENRRK